MRRRRFLAAAGLAVASAGCLNRSPAGTGTTASTTTDETTEGTTPPTTTSAASVSVSETTLKQSLVYLQTDYLTVRGDGSRYLLATVDVQEGRVPKEAFAVGLGDTEYGPMDTSGGQTLWREYNEGEFSPTAGGLLVFELPGYGVADATDGALSWPGGERVLRESVRERLSSDAPDGSFEVSGLTTFETGESPTFDIEVSNHGDAAGRFVAALSRSGPLVASIPVEHWAVLVAPGETKTVTFESSRVSGAEVGDDQLGDDEADVRYTINTANGRLSHEVRYVASEN